MRLLFLISLLFVYTVAPAKSKPDSSNLQKAMMELNNALVKKDSVALSKLLHKKLSYGHSNGWIENKKEVVADLYNGKLTYNKLEQSKQKVDIVRETATVRCTTEIDVVYEGTRLTMTLQVMQVWVWKKGWKLLGRQSVKV